MRGQFDEINEQDARTLMAIIGRCGLDNVWDFINRALGARDELSLSPNLETPEGAEALRAKAGRRLVKPARAEYIAVDIARKCGIIEALPIVAQYCYGGVYVHSADEAADLSDIFDVYEVD